MLLGHLKGLDSHQDQFYYLTNINNNNNNKKKMSSVEIM